MKIIINLALDCLHCESLSVYDHNVYWLKSELLGYDHIKVNFNECSNQHDVEIGTTSGEGLFVAKFFYDAEVTDHQKRLVVYVD